MIYEKSLLEKEFEKDSCGIGMAVNISGEKSHAILSSALSMLERMEHRGAVGYDASTGDGAGVIFQLPHPLFMREIPNLPKKGEYGVAQIFITGELESTQKIIESHIDAKIICWREVPIDLTYVGYEALKTLPQIWQLFIEKPMGCENFENYFYELRCKIERSDVESKRFYIATLSSKTIVYKGLLLANQVSNFYKDLKNPLCETAFAIVHQRFSTNTYPSWKLAHPFRLLAHNGEINTIKGNIYNFLSRESCGGESQEHGFKGLSFEKSDSSNLDSIIEKIVHEGKTLLEAVSIVVPSAWEKNPLMGGELKSFYRNANTYSEPWDGPAAIVLNFGDEIVAKLDRNGLRPSRFVLTHSGTLYLASESGTVDIKTEEIARQGRVKPGEALYIRLDEGKLYNSKEVEQFLVRSKIVKGVEEESVEKIESEERANYSDSDFFKLCKLNMLTREDLEVQIAHIAKYEQESLGSMGNDAALAILSHHPHPLYMHFKQLFAQVTNPPIDPIREACVMSNRTILGANKVDKDGMKRVVKLSGPVISPSELKKVEECFLIGKSIRVSTLFDVCENGELEKAIQRVKMSVEQAIDKGCNLVILSDREISTLPTGKFPIPMLLMLSSLHHHLIRCGKRASVDIIVESGEVKEVMQCATFIGFGALAVVPYFALEAIEYMSRNGLYSEGNSGGLQSGFIQGLSKGLLKVISKMGISTISSYRSSQLFEALGISKQVIEKHFPGVISRIGGLEIVDIEEECRQFFLNAYEKETLTLGDISSLGEFKYRKGGEKRLFSPSAVSNLQHAAREENSEFYRAFAREINEQGDSPITLRGCFEFEQRESIPLEEVESVESIMKRFCTGAMSYGSISKEAHEAIAIAMNTIGGKSNSGEGGESFERLYSDRCSAIKQIASGRFGVTTDYLVNAAELQIKMAQGAKPGEGGHLPGEKVSEEIGKTRHTTPGIDLISPPPHHDIYSIEDLAQLIFDLKNVNETARISVKLVSEAGVGTVAVGVAKAHAEMILISGYDGGTGAAMLSSIRHAGLPWELGLAETHQALKANHLRERVTLQVDGQIKTGRDVVIAAMLGAEEFGFSTAPLVVLGCVLMRACHTNMCPVGIATQNETLRKRFLGRSAYLINYFKFVAQEAREIMASLGVKTLGELVGKSEYLRKHHFNGNRKLETLDFSKILYQVIGKNCQKVAQNHAMESILDRTLCEKVIPYVSESTVEFEHNIRNSDRSVGAMLSGTLSKNLKGKKLPHDRVCVNFTGISGQSFGAFLVQGITFKLFGLANDYVGKGLYGGKIIIQKPQEATYISHENVIAGNTLLFGAICGELYASGMVGERFAVRNSGAISVVEGVGDHACEYMTGGMVLILGSTGINFGAGMSGGIAYVWDLEGDFSQKVNFGMVISDGLDEKDRENIKGLAKKHFEYTQSERAHEFLESFDENCKNIVKIVSPKYKKLYEEGRV